jgi:tetratricopeptide (TPR) repeat protein
LINNKKRRNNAIVNNVAEMHNDAAWNKKGMDAHNAGNYTFAIEAFSKSIELNPQDVYSYFCRGVAYSKLGNLNKAIKDYSKIIELYPQLAFSYNKRGIAYDKLGKHQHAIEDYSEAIRLKPHYADAYYNRALAYSKCDQYQLSIEGFNKAICLKPDYADAYRYRGAVYFLQGRDNLGYRDARKAHTLGNSELLEWAKGEENAVNSEGNLKLIINSNSQFNSNIKVNGK